MQRSHIIITLGSIAVLLALAVASSFFGRLIRQPADVANAVAPMQTAAPAAVTPAQNPNGFIAPPAVINAVYATEYSAGSKSYRAYLQNLFATTNVNAVVIDIKDYSGKVSYDAQIPQVQSNHLYDGAIPDIDSLLQWLHAQNIYVIGRMEVFEDPAFAKANPQMAIYNTQKTANLSNPVLWTDANGLAWMDPASQEVWQYNAALANDALNRGFDEINFDYVRFPTGGNQNLMGFPAWNGTTPEADVIKSFFEYLRTQLPGKVISADLFGQTTSTVGDMGIGQLIQNALGNFNYVDPMVYPSLYASGFIGFENPAEYPYQVVNYEMQSALTREQAFYNAYAAGESADSPAFFAKTGGTETKIRPWLQDYSLNGVTYTPTMVSNEIQATKDALGENYSGFMLWNASNVYSESAIQK